MAGRDHRTIVADEVAARSGERCHRTAGKSGRCHRHCTTAGQRRRTDAAWLSGGVVSYRAADPGRDPRGRRQRFRTLRRHRLSRDDGRDCEGGDSALRFLAGAGAIPPAGRAARGATPTIRSRGISRTAASMPACIFCSIGAGPFGRTSCLRSCTKSVPTCWSWESMPTVRCGR